MREQVAGSLPWPIQRIWRQATPLYVRLYQWAGAMLLPGWATPVAFASLAMLVVQMLDHRYARGSVPYALILTVSLTVLFIMLSIALTYSDQRLGAARRRVITIGLMLALAINTLVHLVMVLPHLADKERYAVDAAAATDCATQMFLHGQDPYTNIHMLTCLADHGLQFNQTTPKRAASFWSYNTYPTPDNAHFTNKLWIVYWHELAKEQHNPRYASPDFETRFNYPGGAILIGVLAWTIGERDLVGLYVTCAILASFLIYRRAAPRIRAAVGLLLLGDTPLLLDSSVGTTDVLYATMLVIYWQVRTRPFAAGLALGLAAATRQQAWFFAPFLLYLAWRTDGWRGVWQRGLLAAVVFLGCNLPFIVMSPGDWVAGMAGPMFDPLFAQGVGLIALSIAFFKQHVGPSIVYGILELGAFAALFRLYTRRVMTAPGLAMLLPLLPLALAWRSLHTYFLVLPLLALAVLADPELQVATGRSVGSAVRRMTGPA